MALFPRRLPQPDPSSYCHQQQQKTLLERKEHQKKLLAQQQQYQQEQKHKIDLYIPNEPVTQSLKNVKIQDPDHNLTNNNDNNSNKLKIKSSSNLNKTTTTLDLNISKSQSPLPLPHCQEKYGFWNSVLRLIQNDVLLCRTASSVLHILPISGLYTFLPKYLESQFQLTAGDANIIAGLAGILVMGFGIFSSGIFMRKYKPSAVFVARWLTFAAGVYVIGMIVLTILGCPTNRFAGLPMMDSDG